MNNLEVKEIENKLKFNFHRLDDLTKRSLWERLKELKKQ